LLERFERPNAEPSAFVPCEQQGCNMRVDRGRCEKHKRNVPTAVDAYLKEKADSATEQFETIAER
jgi:hypothetical protein